MKTWRFVIPSLLLMVSMALPAYFMPTELKASSGDGSITVSWVAPTGKYFAIDHYLVFVYKPGDELVRYLDGIKATTVTIGNLNNGTVYTVEVRAIDSAAMM